MSKEKLQTKLVNIENGRLRIAAVEKEERQKVESANVLAQLRKVQTDSMVAHKRQVDLEVETMKYMVEPNRVDVIQACLNITELRAALET
ncbi:hypothetical protein D8674_019496 [Pyrus ussuriensis x Pyrus communis]|uniref:Uncharacterized protein n=1 Tax=Pyrus ussuriensis x Pyrus communis TaxID=2448454 RepID=A0A5N5GL42_9ROSA|nr:hypothetical protein D8674_019496 [Pyrus ussuriensis x Pyrus communis]